MEDSLKNTAEPELSDEVKNILTKQNSRMVTDFQAKKIEAQAMLSWDKFYKRNETRFFKDRWVFFEGFRWNPK